MESLEKAGANNVKPWNGGIGDKQLRWFKSQCRVAGKKGKRVVVFCHYPLLPENGLQLLNNKELLKTLNDYEDVVDWFSGHHHWCNYLKDENGTHHLTFQGMVEAETEALGAVISVYQNKMVIQGIGQEDDRILEFR
jgi:hypothetical protein